MRYLLILILILFLITTFGCSLFNKKTISDIEVVENILSDIDEDLKEGIEIDYE